MAQQIWAIEDRALELFPGTFAEWLQAGEHAAPQPVSRRARARHRRRDREVRKQVKRDTAQAPTVDHQAQIEEVEARIADLERQLEAASTRQDIPEIARLAKEHQAVRERLERAWRDWNE
jgi:ABC-type phosphate transport system auxiliary subunit